MFLLIRSIRINTGQAQAAFEWSVEICNYLNDAFPNHNVRALRQWLGENGLYFFAEYESLAEYEQMVHAWNTDNGYMSRLQDAGERGLFVPGSLHDRILEQL